MEVGWFVSSLKMIKANKSMAVATDLKENQGKDLKDRKYLFILVLVLVLVSC